jgi:hypothetical protein
VVDYTCNSCSVYCVLDESLLLLTLEGHRLANEMAVIYGPTERGSLRSLSEISMPAAPVPVLSTRAQQIHNPYS